MKSLDCEKSFDSDLEEKFLEAIEQVKNSHLKFVKRCSHFLEASHQLPDEWISVLWYNKRTRLVEIYSVESLEHAQSMVNDIYHFAKDLTRVILRHNGKLLNYLINFDY